MRFLLTLALVLPFALFAETAPQATVSATAGTSSSDGKILGSVELRPSYGSQLGEFHTEDNAVLGYQFNKNSYLAYKQEFFSNVYNPGKMNGTNLEGRDGYLRGAVRNLWNDGALSLGYEGRLLVPTYNVRRDAGMILAYRNYMHLDYKFNGAFTLTLSEAPVAHIYDVAGYKKAANPWFENKVELTGVYRFSDNTKLVVPLKLASTRFRAYLNNAKNNNAWSHNLMLWPEVWHRLDENIQVGAAYYTGSLVNASFDKLTLDSAFKTGVTQLIFAANL